MTTFFLIRHASCSGLGHTLWGRTPGVCLNEKGKLQAQQLAEPVHGHKARRDLQQSTRTGA